MEKYNILIKPSAVKEIEASPHKKTRQQIVHRVQNLATAPYPPGTSKLAGNDRYRLRQGVYRIVYTVWKMQLTINIIKVGHRKDIYKGLLKMPSLAFLETETKNIDFPFPSFSITYVIENGSISLCCAGTSNF